MAFERDDAETVTQEERQKRTEEHDAMVSFLKNFVEHFGAQEVYCQAKYLFEDTPEGEQYFKEEREALKGLLLPELLPQVNAAGSAIQKRAAQAGEEKKLTKYDEARRLLGG